MKWTQALHSAAHKLATDYSRRNPDLDADIRSRAREYTTIRVGHQFEPHQIEYTHCLLQRLDTHQPRDTHVAFKEAWTCANSPSAT